MIGVVRCLRGLALLASLEHELSLIVDGIDSDYMSLPSCHAADVFRKIARFCPVSYTKQIRGNGAY